MAVRKKADLGVIMFNRHNTEVTVNRQPVSRLNDPGCLGNPGHTGDAIFTGNDSSVNQHSATALDNGSSQWRQKSHVWLNGIADQHVTSFKICQGTRTIKHPGPT